jgi:hypothetical protein
MGIFLLILVIILWILCGFGAAGIYYAYFQRRFPTLANEMRERDITRAYDWILYGPVGLVVSLCLSERLQYGWCWPGRDAFQGKWRTRQ